MKKVILKLCVCTFILLFLCENTYADCNIKVSIIIPIYNSERYLNDCLRSVTNQSLQDIEIICINDGSTDNSLAILEDFSKADKRIKIINQENKGASAARNVGLRAARGEYVAFVDSDDTVECMAYEVAYNKIFAEQADVLMFGETFISCKDMVIQDGFLMLNERGSMMPWNKLYKRDFLTHNNFNFFEEAKCYNDECFNSIVLPKAKKLVTISDKFYHYKRRVDGSIQNLANLKKRAENVLVYVELVGKHWYQMGYFKEHSEWFINKVRKMCSRFKDLQTEEQEYFLNRINYRIINFQK